MADYVPPPTADPAVLFVAEGQGKFLAKAEETLAQAQAYIAALSSFTTTPTAFNINFDFEGQLAPFVRPPRPDIDNSEFDLLPQETPSAPPAFLSEDVDLGDIPEFTDAPPTIVLPAQPVRPNVAIPVSPGLPPALVMPDEPGYDTPAPVSLLDLNLPVLPAVQLPVFSSVRPSIAPFSINENFSFTPKQYVSDLLTKIQGRVSTWMDGQEALPVAIEQALFARGRGRITDETQAAEQQAYDDFAARGFSQPPGMLTARVDAIRRKAQDQVADLNREIVIKDFDEALANMRLAVTSGIQLEGTMINLHIEEQRMLLASAQYVRDTAIAILNARIAQFNAEMQGYQVDAQVLETLLKEALAQLDIYRAQLEGEKLKGEINQQTVALYTAQWDAVRTMADFYRTRVEAVKVQADANRIPLELFSEQCKAYDSLLDSYSKEWDGYRSAVEGQTAQVTLYNGLVQAYGTRVDGVTKVGGLKLDRERLRVQEHGQQLAVYDAGLRRLAQLLDTERARLSAVGSKAGSLATIYRADADVEQAASAATDRSFQLGLEEAKADMEAQIETARIKSQENIAMSGLLLEALKSMAQILSQLAASTMSAVNYSASVSSSASDSRGRSVSWSGEAEDWNPTFV
jgi:hypothetical protein